MQNYSSNSNNRFSNPYANFSGQSQFRFARDSTDLEDAFPNSVFTGHTQERPAAARNLFEIQFKPATHPHAQLESNAQTAAQDILQRKLQNFNANYTLTKARLRVKMERYLESVLSGQTSAHHETAQQEYQTIVNEIKSFQDKSQELKCFSECLFETLRKQSKAYADFVVKQLAPGQAQGASQVAVGFQMLVDEVEHLLQTENEEYHDKLTNLIAQKQQQVAQFQEAMMRTMQRLNRLYQGLLLLCALLGRAHVQIQEPQLPILSEPAEAKDEKYFIKKFQKEFHDSVLRGIDELQAEVSGSKFDLIKYVRAFYLIGYAGFEAEVLAGLEKLAALQKASQQNLDAEATSEDEDEDILFKFDFATHNVDINLADLPVIQRVLEGYQQFALAVVAMGWHDTLLKQNLVTVVEKQVQRKIQQTRHEYRRESVELALLKWTQQIIVRFFQLTLDFSQIMQHSNEQIYDAQSVGAQSLQLQRMLSQVSQEIARHQFAMGRLDELFNFIRETTFDQDQSLMKGLPRYVYDLKKILGDRSQQEGQKSGEPVSDENQSYYLVCKLRDQIMLRLLIPSTDTDFIIRFYIQVITVLKFLDPSTILLEIVSAPIKEYIRSRKDSLRCIVKTIISNESELYSQLGEQHIQINQRPADADKLPDDGNISTDEDEEAAEKWQPVQLTQMRGALAQASNLDKRPFELERLKRQALQNDFTQFISQKRRQSDIISNLVNIYGSQDAFIKVYKSMLDERLLDQANFSLETEIKNIELLKLRFGDNSLVHCEVMLKDIKFSKIINTEIQKQVQQKQIKERGEGDGFDFDLSKIFVNVVSRGDYWDRFPANDEEEEETGSALNLSSGFMPPKKIAQNMTKFLKHYQQFKMLRTLKFNQTIGSVCLTLDFKNCSQSFRVTPVEASVISLFSAEDGNEDEVVTLSLEQLKEKLTAQPPPDQPVDPMFADEEPAQSISLDDVNKVCQQWVHRGVLKLIHNPITKETLYQNVDYYDQSKAAIRSQSDGQMKEDESGSLFVKSNGPRLEHGQIQGASKAGGPLQSDKQKLLETYIMTILGFRNQPTGLNVQQQQSSQNSGKTLEKIFSLLNTVYMRGQGLAEKEVKDVLQGMVMSGRIRFIEGRYITQ